MAGGNCPHPEFRIVGKNLGDFLLVGNFLSKNAKLGAEPPHFGEIKGQIINFEHP